MKTINNFLIFASILGFGIINSFSLSAQNLELTLTMNDTYGDGWNGNSIIINDVPYTLSSGSSSDVNISIEAGSCIIINWTSGSWIEETSWTLQNAVGILAQGEDGLYDRGYGVCEIWGCIDPSADNYNPDVTLDDGMCQIQGCTDMSAFNYNADANEDDGSCIAVVNGCTDEAASNYNAEANTDDGMCQIQGCMDPSAENYNPSATVDDNVILTLVDSYGDTWNGGFLTINGVNYDQPTNPGYNPNGGSDTYEISLDLSVCSDIIYTAGSYTSENSWSITGACGNTLSSAGNSSGTVGNCSTPGCTSDWADNYDANATSDNGLCFKEGCVSEWADNTDLLATIDDGSCTLDACMSSWADNYNLNATTDDGSCTLDACMSSWADNYDANATTDNGSCSLIGCMSSWADNYDANATSDNGLCFKEGCTSEWADNTDLLATIDDGSCTLDACMSSWADNYDANATTEDGSCTLDACMSSWADNYDANATTDNGSCVLLGCMEDWADNYTVNATSQLPNEINVENVLFSELEFSVDSSFETSSSSTNLLFSGYSLTQGNTLINECLQGYGYSCLQANNPYVDFYQFGYSYDAASYMDYCFNSNDYYSCDQAAMMYPIEMADFLSDSPNQYLVDECLQGYGYSCLQANNPYVDFYQFGYSYDAASYMDYCFNSNDSYSCDQAAMMYPSEMADFLNYDESELFSGSLNITIPSSGDFSISYSYYSTGSEQYFYILNSDTIFLNTYYGTIDFSANTADVLSFGMTGSSLGSIDLYNFNFDNDLGSPSCYKEGCMSEWADNFDAISTIDNGSCSLVGCMSDWADGYDANATVDDGTCDRLGCMEDWADNYDGLATTTDNSCYRIGCMSDWADNYDILATQDAPEEFNLNSMNTTIYPENSDGSVVINSNNFIISGINNNTQGFPNGTNQTLTIPIQSTGNYSFNWQHTDYDLDGAFYAVNFDPTTLINFYSNTDIVSLAQNGTGEYQNGVESWEGSIEVSLSEGDQITFGVFGEDLCCGIGVLTVEDFMSVDNGLGSCYRNGCTDSLACNYDPIATIDDGNCGTILTLSSSESEYYCSDYSWGLYNSDNQVIENGDCEDNIEVCLSQGEYSLNSYNPIDSEWWPSWTYVEIDEMNSVSTFNDSGNNIEDSLIFFFTIEFGCTDEQAKNFNSSATVDDGSCNYGSCMNELACNYDETAVTDDGSCIFIINDCQTCLFIHDHFELIENDDDSDGICNEFDIEGCTDDSACNFDPFATEDDGSCIIINQCTDCLTASGAFAVNNDTDGDGICNENEVLGCNVISACNFNSNATDFDGSCVFPPAGLDCSNNCVDGLPLVFGGGAWISEAFFNIVDCDNNSIISGGGIPIEAFTTCVDLPENYSIYIEDTYGDGWNGNTITIGDSVYGLIQGSDTIIDYGCIIPGCNIVGACNYNETASVDDGSCVFPAPWRDCENQLLDLNNNMHADSLDVPGCFDNNPVACNYNGDFNPAISIHVPDLCTYPPSGFDCAGNCMSDITYVLQMNDSYGDGWNGNKITIDGVVYTLDSGSEGSESICIDPDKCYNFEFTPGSYSSEVTWSIFNQEGVAISDNSETPNLLENQGAFFSQDLGPDYQGVPINGTFGNCTLISGCIDSLAINYNENAGIDDGSCVAVELGCTDSDAFNFNPDANNDDNSCEFSGCTIQFAINYDPEVTIEDGSCIIAVYGCTDETAFNYNADANVDDDSCDYGGVCQYDTMIVTLSDSYGDGWNGNILSIAGNSITLEHNSESFTTVYGTDTICLDPNYCNTITVNGGTWANEVSWTIETLSHDVLISGGAPFAGTFGDCLLDQNGNIQIDGCMDPIANNYDAYANIQNSNSNCIYSSNYDDTEQLGCNDFLAINYNPGAQSFSDAACIYYGCMNQEAQNFNSLATYDDGSCNFTCEEGFIADCDGSGECHPESWIGDNYGDCEDQQWGADLTCYQNDGGDCGGFDPEWNADPISLTNWDLWCEYEISLGCYVCDNDYMYTNCATECSDCDINNNSEDIQGCMDVLSLNYNQDATVQDNSCQFLSGCTSELACNYDANAVQEDNSCLFSIDGEDCDDILSYQIQQSGLVSFEPYVIKDGLCSSESYFLTAHEYYMKGVDYSDIVSEDGMFFEFEHANNSAEQSPILFGDTVLIKINNLYISANLDLVSLTTESNKAIKIILSPKMDTYIGIQINNFDKFNMVGLFDDESVHKSLDRRLIDNLYSWTDEFIFGSFRASHYLDYSEIYCGCTNPLALNYDSFANENDNTCAIEGCMDPYNSLFDPIANVSGSCDSLIEGCIYDWAFNYNPIANLDNGSCITFAYGCIDSLYLDFDPLANTDDGSCQNLIIEGCTDSLYIQYWLYNQSSLAVTQPFTVANTDDGSCSDLIINGCSDSDYVEYNDSTNVSDLSMCETLKIFGCTDSLYTEFDVLANTNDSTCSILKIFGCTDSLFTDFDSLANTIDTCLYLIVQGCMNTNFTEFNISNNVSSPDSCITPNVYGCIDPMFVEFNELANTDNGTCATYLVIGCSNPLALNYTLGVTSNDNSLCVFEQTYGCTSFVAFNYDAYADIDDGSCIDIILGCMYDLAFNYDPLVNTDDGSCILVYEGCTDSIMFNFNENANVDDGSCFPIVLGCMEITAINYNSSVNTDDGSCVPIFMGCTDSIMYNYDSLANFDDGSCFPIVYGCLNVTYVEYNSDANVDDQSCINIINQGCTNELYVEYNELANTNDGSCLELSINGCTDNSYLEYNELANTDDGTCEEFIVLGCTDELMYNYDETANVDDSSCYMLTEGCTDSMYFEYDSLANFDDGTCDEFIIMGCMDNQFIEFNSEANLSDGSCEDLLIPGCTNALYLQFSSLANINDGSCETLIILGCTDPTMYNYFPTANTDNGGCFSLTSFELNPLDFQFNMSITAQIEESPGEFSTNTTDSIILISSVTNEVSGFATLEYIPFGVNNYYAFITAYSNNLSDDLNVYVMTSGANQNNQIIDNLEFIPNSMIGSVSDPLILSIGASSGNYGCTNPNALNYNSLANINNGSCVILGCTNSDYTEYFVEANQDDGSCLITWQAAYQSQLVNYNLVVDSLNQANISILSLEESLGSDGNTNSTDSRLIDHFIDFPNGWSLFGYNCYNSMDMATAFDSISDRVIIIKDETGSSFLPEYNFNGIGDLIYTEGYQIKTSEEITEFQFCQVLILD